ncbi:MAG TPA: STAS domain-containing protein [Chloroflexota bacterium]
MARIPIVRIRNTLVATFQKDLYDRDALDLQSSLNDLLERTGCDGVLLDMSMVETVDSFLGRMINDVAQGARLLGAHTVVVGLQPAVAITLVELGLELPGVHTALDVERGLVRLQRIRAAGARQGSGRAR